MILRPRVENDRLINGFQERLMDQPRGSASSLVDFSLCFTPPPSMEIPCGAQGIRLIQGTFYGCTFLGPDSYHVLIKPISENKGAILLNIHVLRQGCIHNRVSSVSPVGKSGAAGNTLRNSWFTSKVDLREETCPFTKLLSRFERRRRARRGSFYFKVESSTISHKCL